MIWGCGVIRLTMRRRGNINSAESGRPRARNSGYRSFGDGEHPAGEVEHFYRGKMLGEEAGVCLCVVRGIFADRAQNQNRQVGCSVAQLGDERRPTYSWQVMA